MNFKYIFIFEKAKIEKYLIEISNNIIIIIFSIFLIFIYNPNTDIN